MFTESTSYLLYLGMVWKSPNRSKVAVTSCYSTAGMVAIETWNEPYDLLFLIYCPVKSRSCDAECNSKATSTPNTPTRPPLVCAEPMHLFKYERKRGTS